MKFNILDISQEDFLLFLEGDQRIFRIVFDRYYASIYRYVQSMSQQQEIEDIVQQCFIQLFKHKSKINDASGVYPYLFVIAKRLVIMSFRKRVLETKYQNEIMYTGETNCLSTQKQLNFNDLQKVLADFMELLPPKQREIYRLNKLQGYSYEEISLVTGCSKNTVKNHLIAASRKIKALISSYYVTIVLFFFF